MKSSVIEEEEKEEENKEGTSLEEISFVSLFLGERRHTVLPRGLGRIVSGQLGEENSGGVFSRREETLAASKMMRARATKPKHREDAYFLGEQLRAHTQTHAHTFEIPEGDAGVSRTISSDSASPPTPGGPPALFSAVFPRIYIRMVAAFPDAGARGGKGERNRGSSIPDRANFPTERTPKTFLGDIQCLRDASTGT